jgi:hypothetical protein
MTSETLHLNMTVGQIPGTDVMISMIGGTIINSQVKLNMKLSGPVETIVPINAIYSVVQNVFVMEDGSTPFIDETNTNTFKPE